MKIECDKCAAKYSIADEKVRGKTFKIRCKKCSNVIIVRDKGAAADADTDDSGADQAAPGWHLAINGETVGPLAEDDVRARYAGGEIDKDTAIWQEGFEDWIPLGDVATFADLPDAAPMGGGYDDGYGQDEDDPFANANQEDYAAGAAAASAAAVAASAPMNPGPASPRVSSLTGQRNENSVLFSLDSLQALATGGNQAPKPTAGSNQHVGTKGLATTAPGSEGSGLIDIRALGSMVGGDQPSAHSSSSPAAVDDAALPSFGGTGLGGLAAAPLVAPHRPEPASAAAAAAPPPPQRSNAPIYILMVLLILALGGLAAYILLKPEKDPQIIVKEVPGAAPSVADKDDEDEDKDKDKDEKDEEEDEEDEDAEDEAGEEEDAGDDEAGGSKTSSKRSSKKKPSSSGKKKSSDPLAGFGDPPAKKSTTPKAPTASKKDDVSVDCILDPSKCKKSSSKPSSGASKPADPNLPVTLTSSDIRDGVAPHKAAAKSCGGKHGASPGTKVKVKLSISGSTGTVSSAAAQAPHNGTPLGNCVAAAVKKSKFKKFQKSTLGAVYPFTM